jgi:predicted SnoaL-like aldol condensation-catalyzing enzyme
MKNHATAPVEIRSDNEKIIRNLYQEIMEGGAVMVVFGKVNPSGTSSIVSLLHFFSNLAEAFPEFEMKIEDLRVEGERVMVRYAVSGIQRGSFLGNEPTNELMSVRVIDIFRLENGHVAEYWEAARQLNAWH